jgi:hypothetical protein
MDYLSRGHFLDWLTQIYATELEARGGLPTVDEIMAQFESGVTSHPLTHSVSGT